MNNNSDKPIAPNQQPMAGNRQAPGAVQPPRPQPPQQPPQQQYSQADLNKIVLEYLNKKGYHKTEMMLRNESAGVPIGFNQQFPVTAANAGIPNTQPVMIRQQQQQKPSNTPFKIVAEKSQTSDMLSDIDGQAKDPNLYFKGYKILRDWINSSLDLYKPQLLKLLYPIFVNCFIDLINLKKTKLTLEFFNKFKDDHIISHGKEIVEMSAISLVDHLKLSGIMKNFRERKYKVKISSVCVYLLLFFLNENKNVGGDLIIRLINQHIDLEISTDKLGFNNRSALDPDEGIPEFNESNIEEFNSKELKLGRLPRDENFDKEIENELRMKDEKEAAKKKSIKTSLVEEFQKIKSENPNPTATEQVQVDENNSIVDDGSDMDKISDGIIFDSLKKNDPNFESPSKDALPIPPKTIFDLKKEVQIVQDSRSRLKLSFEKNQFSPPSICMYTFHNSLDEITCLEFNENSNLVAAGFEDSYIKLWSIDGNPLKSIIKNDPQNKSNTRRLIGHSGTVYSLSFSPDGNYLLSASEDGTVRLWSLDTYTCLVIYKSHNDPVWDVKFSPFGHYFVTASHDTTARLWSVDHIYPLRLFVGHMSDVDCVAWFPNACYCFTGSSDKTIRMWDILKGECVRLFVGHSSAINALAVHPRGRLLASAGEDSMIHLWDISHGRLLKSMRGHSQKCSIYSLDFSKDGNVLVSGGSDNSVRIWDVKKNSELQLSEPEPFFNNVDENASISNDVSKQVVSNKNGTTGGGPGNNGGNGGASGSANEGGRKKNKELGSCTNDHVGAYFTKQTSVFKVHFTRRNLCLAAGIFSSGDKYNGSG
ncbi:chromatin modification protein [Saccharomycopsis crataegensis]|uniref:Chromatin modification protein n=1 Tax=Saccharomycopsis crataegensis TaxID=43959 RepID=A0AAV5QMY1_9ASCO|nr:chromatin modification protein [Saccharomycopsis crataegensis]